MSMELGACIPFEKCENFRELGGYEAKNGKTVRRGAFYRTAALYPIKKEEELVIFNELGIRHIFDFRSEAERKQHPDPNFENVLYHPIAATLTENQEEMNFDLPSLVTGGENAINDLISSVAKGYEYLPFNNPAYAAMFDAIKNCETPILFHCSAGKDRTGVAAALILLMLGVSEETVMHDYMLTNQSRKNSVARMIEEFGHYFKENQGPQFLNILAGVEKQNLECSLNAIKLKYGTYNEYFESEYKIDDDMLQKIKQNYLD